MVWQEAFELIAVRACVHSFDLVGVIEVDSVRCRLENRAEINLGIVYSMHVAEE